MTETPLEKLDTAIHEFFQEIGADSEGRYLTGWVMAAATARLQTDSDTSLPLVTGSQYSVGPQTSITQMAGLVRYLDVVAEKVMWQQLSAPEEE